MVPEKSTAYPMGCEAEKEQERLDPGSVLDMAD
jgi:hypothetical protein